MTGVALGDVCEVTTGQSAPQDPDAFGSCGIPFIRAGSLERLCAGESENSLEFVAPDKAKQYRLKVYPENTVVFPKSGMSAKVGRVYRLKRGCHLVSHLAAVLPSKQVDSSYLHRWFEYSPPSRLIENDAYPSIKTSTIEKIRIPLPPLTEQRRIAVILDKADALRSKRREAIAKLDQLLQSVFLDMFGNPVTNPKGWPIHRISELLESVKYGSSAKASLEGDVPILRMNNLTYSGGMDMADLKYIAADQAEEKYLVKPGDILFNRTNSKELVGKTAVYVGPTPMAYAGYLVRGRVLAGHVPEYISAFLNSRCGKAILRNMCKSIVGMANINAKEFGSIELPVPPSHLQVRFQKNVQAIRDQRRTLQQHAIQLDTLFASLQHRAFSGTL